MKLFKKKGVDVIDFTDLQRKGVINRAKLKENSVNESGFVDLSSSESSNSSGLSFLDNLAGANSSVTENLKEARQNSTVGLGEIRIKLDDLEFKFGQLMEKIALLESRLDEIKS